MWLCIQQRRQVEKHRACAVSTQKENNSQTEQSEEISTWHTTGTDKYLTSVRLPVRLCERFFSTKFRLSESDVMRPVPVRSSNYFHIFSQFFILTVISGECVIRHRPQRSDLQPKNDSSQWITGLDYTAICRPWSLWLTNLITTF